MYLQFSSVGRFESYLVANPEDRFSRDEAQKVDLNMTFVDLTKAFDTVSRDRLRKFMAKFCCPVRFIAISCGKSMMASLHGSRTM